MSNTDANFKSNKEGLEDNLINKTIKYSKIPLIYISNI